MLTISSKADDILSGESENENSSSDEYVSDTTSWSSKTGETQVRKRRTTVTTDKMKSGGEETYSDDDSPKPKRCKKDEVKNRKNGTDRKVQISKKRMPKTQTAAMWQMVQTIETSASQQERNSDEWLTTLLEAERKRDEMFISFQREQAEANRKHELLIAQLLMQSGSNQLMGTIMFIKPALLLLLKPQLLLIHQAFMYHTVPHRLIQVWRSGTPCMANLYKSEDDSFPVYHQF